MTTQPEQSWGPPWTVLKMLQWTTQFLGNKGIDSARFEAELLLAHSLDMERVKLYAEFDRPLEESELASFRGLVKRRATGEPVAYIVGRKGFWTFEVKTDSRALIPRPETETLVEWAIARHFETALDIGTGTGILALALALEKPNATIVATDIESDALALAQENTELLQVTNLTLKQSDLFSDVTNTFDLIVSNPPYIGTNERELVDDAVDAFEPKIALYSGPEGLELIGRLIATAPEYLNPTGTLGIEIGFQQGSSVKNLFEKHGFTDVAVLKDLAGHDRVVVGTLP